jgi:hypothetical protein
VKFPGALFVSVLVKANDGISLGIQEPRKAQVNVFIHVSREAVDQNYQGTVSFGRWVKDTINLCVIECCYYEWLLHGSPR